MTAFQTSAYSLKAIATGMLPLMWENGGAIVSLDFDAQVAWPIYDWMGVSKAGLDKLVEAWRAEHPNVGFTRVVVGDCGDANSGFASGWDLDDLMEFHPIWVERGLLAGSLISVEHLVTLVDAVLRGGASLSIPSITLAPRPPAPPA